MAATQPQLQTISFLDFCHANGVPSCTSVQFTFSCQIWLLYFLSLTGDESESDVVSHYFSRKSKRTGLLSFLRNAQETMLPDRVKKGY